MNQMKNILKMNSLKVKNDKKLLTMINSALKIAI